MTEGQGRERAFAGWRDDTRGGLMSVVVEAGIVIAGAIVALVIAVIVLAVVG